MFDESLTVKLPIDIKTPGIFESILLGLITPYFVFQSLSITWNWKTGSIASKCKELKDVPNKYENQFLCSRELSLIDIKARFKKKKSGFTPYMLGVISKSFYEWFDHYGVKGAERIVMCAATGLKNFPETYEELCIDNKVSFTKVPLPVTQEIDSCIRILKNTMKTMFDRKMML